MKAVAKAWAGAMMVALAWSDADAQTTSSASTEVTFGVRGSSRAASVSMPPVMEADSANAAKLQADTLSSSSPKANQNLPQAEPFPVRSERGSMGGSSPKTPAPDSSRVAPRRIAVPKSSRIVTITE